MNSGSWGNGDNLDTRILCDDGNWIPGFWIPGKLDTRKFCVASNSTCLSWFPYTTDTTGCREFYSAECPPNNIRTVIAVRNPCFGPEDCPGYDPNTHLKLYCDLATFTCKPLEVCEVPTDCDNGWCCDIITGARDCKAKGTILSYEGKSWLCDPPGGFISLAKENKKKLTRKLNLFDLLINPFYLLIR